MNQMSVGMRAMSAPVGLYGHVRTNHLRSLGLFAGFIVAFQLMALAMLLVPLLMFDWQHAPVVGGGGYSQRYLLPVTCFGALLFACAYWWHVSAVRRDTGFRYVDGNDEPRLCRLIEPLIIAAGLRPPYVGVIESPALNAFACGVRDSHMVVVVTRGLLDSLDDEELEAVLAHELMHIRNRDTRLMAAANAFIANLTWLRQNNSRTNLENWRSAVGLIICPFLLPLVLLINFVSQVAFRIGYCSRAMIGSSREFIADAEAIRLTQNPAAMISALRKVHGRDEISGLAASHDAMLIAGAVEGPTATHPTIAQRIGALIQVTGPMASYAPVRRDTRLPEQRRSSGFGRALGQDLTEMVATAERPSIWAILRLTRDPERNLLGLNRKGMVVVLLSVMTFLLFYRGLFTSDLSAQKATKTAEQFNDLARTGVKCQLQGFAHILGIAPMGDQCSSAVIEGQMGTFSNTAGIPYTPPDAKFRKFAELQMSNRCFHRSLHNWPNPSPLPLTNSSSEPVQTMAFYQRFAEQPIQGVDKVLPVEEADRRVEEYAALRMLLLDHVTYYFGKPGRDQFNLWLDTPRHQKALWRLEARLRDPAYRKSYERRVSDNDFVAAEVLVKHPFEIAPCDALQADGQMMAPAPE